jgi:hypothetical protein
VIRRFVIAVVFVLGALGYDGPFTRDLFETEIAVPGFAAPLHVFTMHLNATFTTNFTGSRHFSASIACREHFHGIQTSSGLLVMPLFFLKSQ